MIEERYSRSYFEGWKKRGNRNVANIYFRNFVLQQVESRNKLLEIGCAKGEFLKLIEKEFYEVIGLDVSQYAINKSKSRLRKAKTFTWDIEKGINTHFNGNKEPEVEKTKASLQEIKKVQSDYMSIGNGYISVPEVEISTEKTNVDAPVPVDTGVKSGPIERIESQRIDSLLQKSEVSRGVEMEAIQSLNDETKANENSFLTNLAAVTINRSPTSTNISNGTVNVSNHTHREKSASIYGLA